MAKFPPFNRANAFILNEDSGRWAFMVQDGDDPFNPPEADATRVEPFRRVDCYVFDDPDWVPLTQF